MGRYRKKPVVIEARQLDRENAGELVEWINAHVAGFAVMRGGTGGGSKGGTIYIDTLEGTVHASVGDWVVQGVQGEFYPVKPDVFRQTYEPA